MPPVVIATAAAAAVTGVVSLVQGNQNRIAAQKSADKQEYMQNVLYNNAQQQQKDQNDKANLVVQRNQQKGQQQSTALASEGRSGTILTSPLGVQGTPNTSNKTILGS